MSNGMERRQFLKVLGVSGAGATMASCGGTGAAERLIPYVVPPDEIVPGMATWYRTTCRECPAGCGMNIRTREGRAVKAEGNPLSPISHGALCARGQASLHGLYNPDRVPQPLQRQGDGWQVLTWDNAEQRLAEALTQNRGRTVLLTDHVTGSMDVLLDEFSAAFGVERVRYEPFAWEPLRAAHRLLFGQDAVPVHDFSNADVVITFGADFLETWLSPIDYAHGFVQGRAYHQGRRGRLISITPHQTLTDMNADEWVPIRPGTEHLVALALARLIADSGGQAGGAAARIASVDVAQAAQAADVSPERLRQIAQAFANGGRSLAVGPGVSASHSAATAVAAAVAVLNSAAGNYGTTIRVAQREQHASPQSSYAAMQQLVARMANGGVGALLVYGPNPVYSMPEHAQVTEAFGRVSFVASFSPYLDETSARAHLLLPDHHFLESWGDYEPRTGVVSLIQPVMTPVFSTKQTGDVLLSTARRAGATLPSAAATFYDYLRERWTRDLFPAAGAAAPTFDDWWVESLQAGVVLRPGAQGGAPQTAAAPQAGGAAQTTAAPQTAAAPQAGGAAQTTAAPQAAAAQTQISAPGLDQVQFEAAQYAGDEGDYYLVVYPSYRYYDGRLANRPWLQELPDPISKFTWSSWVEIHPDTADELGLDDGHLVEVSTPFTTQDEPIEVPVFRHPGTRPDTIAIQIGQGHDAFGTYAKDRGVNAYRLIGPQVDPTSGGLVFQQVRAKLRPTGNWRRPVQAGLHKTQRNRGIAPAMTLASAQAADQERGLPVAATVTAAEPPHEEAAAGPHGPAQHPLDAHVRQLQETGGFGPVEMDASPSGYPPPGTHYGEYTTTQPRWGLAIDLERCIGCSACMTACYAENNIGIVGPNLVAQGRIMHWIRLERYFEGEGEDLETRFLPMLCQHCGNAPCEPVCPVFAAYHTPDGLNGQIYNRCVGTRYCANNCPYKVRYFNWFSYEWPEPLNWQLNPDVTVREKGVMEKCTMCVQRIRDAENHARLEGRGVRDGEITPACAQTCPGEAIVFGNFRDPNSRVSRVAASGRGYRVLDQLNTQSGIVYLKKISEHASATAEH